MFFFIFVEKDQRKLYWKKFLNSTPFNSKNLGPILLKFCIIAELYLVQIFARSNNIDLKTSKTRDKIHLLNFFEERLRVIFLSFLNLFSTIFLSMSFKFLKQHSCYHKIFEEEDEKHKKGVADFKLNARCMHLNWVQFFTISQIYKYIEWGKRPSCRCY